MQVVLPFGGVLCLFGSIFVWMIPRPVKMPNRWTENRTYYWIDTGKFDGKDDMRWWMTVYADKPMTKADVATMIQRLHYTKMGIQKKAKEVRPA